MDFLASTRDLFALVTLLHHDSMVKRARTEPEVAKQGPMDKAGISKMRWSQQG